MHIRGISAFAKQIKDSKKKKYFLSFVKSVLPGIVIVVVFLTIVSSLKVLNLVTNYKNTYLAQSNIVSTHITYDLLEFFDDVSKKDNKIEILKTNVVVNETQHEFDIKKSPEFIGQGLEIERLSIINQDAQSVFSNEPSPIKDFPSETQDKQFLWNNKNLYIVSFFQPFESLPLYSAGSRQQTYCVLYKVRIMNLVKALIPPILSYFLIIAVLCLAMSRNGIVIANQMTRLGIQEEKAKLSSQQFDMFLSNAPIPLRVIDKTMRIVMVNDAYKRLLGKEDDELLGQLCSAVTPISICHTEDCPFARLQKDPLPIEHEVEVRTRRGLIPVIKSSSRLYNKESNEFLGIIESVYDISMYKQQQEQTQLLTKDLMESNDDLEDFNTELIYQKEQMQQLTTQLEKSNEAFETTNVDLEGQRAQSEALMELLMKSNDTLETSNVEMHKSNSEMSEFLHVVSHNLREPLRAVFSYLDLIKKRYTENLPEKAHELMQFSIDGARKMDNLITDLVIYSSVGSTGREFAEVDMNIVWESILNRSQLAIKSRNAKIESHDLPKVFADKIQLSQLLQNLLLNALKYNDKDEPLISFSCELSNGNFVFRMKDNGPGIAPENREAVFSLFQQLDFEKGGRGLGLALSRKIVERHGGSIRIEENADDIGCTFVFEIKDMSSEHYVAA